MKKIVIALLLIALIVSSWFYFTREKEFLYNGSIYAIETTLSSRVGGTIKKYLVNEGDNIKAGDLICEIDAPDIEIAYNLALSNYQRAQKLIASATMSRENYDAVKYKYEDSALKLSWTKIYSPADGQVVYKFYENGEFINIGSKIVSINNINEVDVDIYAAYDMLAKLQISSLIKGYLPELKNKEFTGKIIFINNEAEFTPRNVLTKSERERLVFRIKARFINEDNILKPGMTIEVKLPD
ncbi:MAG: efflux RND transporter periplasmic adaptor subunit [Elusimicrobiota bacterium]|jgi:HlyD family secretion protein|nr:efflux RND transporter periplasmic adaptor subunit [Elusimicrobiota bacterium]